MLKRLIVSESQKNEILNLHHILNEEDGTFSIEGSVIDGLNKREIPFARLSLKQNDKTLKEIQADINAKFKFDKLSSGSYSVVISAKNEGYTDKTEEVTINNQNIIDLTFKLEKLKELQEVKVGEIQITIFDFYFLNYKGKPIKDVNITLKSPTTSWKKELQTSNGKISASFDSFGNYVNDTDTIKVNKSLNKNEQFYSESTSCTEFKTIDIDIEYKKDKKFTKQIEYCIKNGSYKASELTTEEENVVMRKPSTKPQRFDNAVNSNI
jgi:hypothetical protein